MPIARANAGPPGAAKGKRARRAAQSRRERTVPPARPGGTVQRVLAVSVRRVGEGRSVRRPPGGASRSVSAAPWVPGSPRMVMLDGLAF
jgi:hypothetical protein